MLLCVFFEKGWWDGNSPQLVFPLIKLLICGIFAKSLLLFLALHVLLQRKKQLWTLMVHACCVTAAIYDHSICFCPTSTFQGLCLFKAILHCPDFFPFFFFSCSVTWKKKIILSLVRCTYSMLPKMQKTKGSQNPLWDMTGFYTIPGIQISY